MQTIKGVAKQFPEQAHYISMVAFNGLEIKDIHFAEPVEQLQQIDATQYRPDASTPLYDAMGSAILKLKNHLETVDAKHNVLVSILTDGEENASKEFSAGQIKTLVEQLRQQNWTFTYIGADHDVERVAFSLSIINTFRFEKNEDDIANMMTMEKNSRYAYSKKISESQSTDAGFYDADE